MGEDDGRAWARGRRRQFFMRASIFIALAAVVFVIVVVIGSIRLLNVYVFSSHQWITYVAIGALSIVAGFIIWRKRRPLTLRK